MMKVFFLVAGWMLFLCSVNAQNVIVSDTVKTVNNKKSTNDILILLDGKKISSKDLDKINPTDIESVHVLKDSAALAIYGCGRGVKGALIITTKKKIKN